MAMSNNLSKRVVAMRNLVCDGGDTDDTLIVSATPLIRTFEAYKTKLGIAGTYGSSKQCSRMCKTRAYTMITPSNTTQTSVIRTVGG